jgi:hypothetical protein
MTVTPQQPVTTQPTTAPQADQQPQQQADPQQQAQQGGGYDYAAAVAKHKRNVKKLDELISAGVKDAKDKKKDADYGVKWPNSAQWIGEAKSTRPRRAVGAWPARSPSSSRSIKVRSN